MCSVSGTTYKPSGDLFFDMNTGWILWKSYAPAQEGNLKICWLPIELRGNVFTSLEGLFAIASSSTHQLTVIDFAPLLQSLYKQGLIL
jgi:hypothetical protein